MLERVLPDGVQHAEARTRAAADELWEGEEALVSGAVEQRRAEFATVRACARDALRLLGMSACPILNDPHGAPIWPPHVVGSMTHCPGYCAAAVAHEADIVSLGIDAEPAQHLPEDVLSLVLLDEERRSVDELSARRPDLPWETIAFSAKESVFKAWFPLAQRWLGFEDAMIRIHPTSGELDIRLLIDAPTTRAGPLDTMHGRWTVDSDYVVTAVVVPRLPG